MSTLQKYEPQGELARPEPTPMGLMQLAIEGKCDVGTLERLSALNEKYEAKKAKGDFDAALAAFQSESPIILKSVNGAQNKYKYAPLDHIVSQVRPLLEKYGFSYKLTSVSAEMRIKAIIKITHRGGHWEESEFEVPVDQTKSREGAFLMSQPQYFGAALTFATRRVFCQAFGILTADRDTDGQGPQAKQGLKSLRGEPKPAEAASGATDKTRAWMIGKLEPIRQDATGYMIEKGWIMPNEGLEHCPLSKVPTTPAQVGTLAAEIEKWAGR